MNNLHYGYYHNHLRLYLGGEGNDTNRRISREIKVVAIVTLLCLGIVTWTSPTFAFVNGQEASLEIGQHVGANQFTSNTAATNQTGLHSPYGITSDSSGNLWVVDASNNRVLEFKPPFSNGMSASLVLGQSSFTTASAATSQTGMSSPGDVTFDSSGNLWVSDLGNNRVTEFKPPFSNGMSASLVLGQSSFTTASAATSQTGMNEPNGISFDSSGNLWVSEATNNRVLEFKPPFSNGMSASLVLGQSSFTTASAATSQTGMNFPFGVSVDSSDNIWIADSGNNRVTEFKPPFSNGMSASLVLGQSSFTTNTVVTSQTGMNFPYGLAFNSNGNLWIADEGNNRVTEFKPPFSNGTSASLVLGQSSFNSGGSATSQTGMFGPDGIAFDSSGNIWVSDTFNNRALEFAEGAESSSSETKAVSGGAATSDQTSTTGIKVTISGISSGSSVLVTTLGLGSQFKDIPPLSSGTKYVDVSVIGIIGGTAQVCINNAALSHSSTTMYYYSGTWVAASTTVSGTTVCGNIPVSALTGTNIGVANVPIVVGAGGSTPGRPPSFTTGFSKDEYPLTINNNLYKLPNYTNTGPLSTIPVGSPFVIKILLYGDNGPSSVKHVSLFTNMRGNYESLVNSNTVLSYDATQPLQISDPNHFFGPITANATIVGNKLQVTFSGTFAKPMLSSDIGIRTWEYDLYSGDVYVLDAWQATASVKTLGSTVGTVSHSQILNTTSIVTKTNTANTTTSTHADTNTTANTTTNDLITSVKEWAGYSPTAIYDSQMLQSMGYHGAHIPSWVMKSVAQYLVDGTITQDEFAGTIKYLADNHIIR